MGWEFEMVAGPFNPRLTEGPAWDGKALLFTHIPASRIYRADPQPNGTWVCKRMTFDETTGTNGLLISTDQRTLYMIQTNPERRELRAYDIQSDGSLGHYTVLHQFGEDYRGPQRGIDGMCFDAEGNIFATAGSYASGPGPMIYIWVTNGRVLETQPMPVGVDTPTNCTFGDPEQRTPYITTGGGTCSGSGTQGAAAGAAGRRCGSGRF